MRLLVALTLLLAAAMVQCHGGDPSQQDLEDIDHHLANPPETRTDQKTIKKFTLDMDDLKGLLRVLKKILIVRVAGTPQIRKVEKFIKEEMRHLNWHVGSDTFEDPKTVLGPKNFSNVIATLNPGAPRRLIIACHYDSKRTPKGFLGAIDSALPCAQMINLASVMKKELEAHNSTALGKKLTLQFLFFDGEESFITWRGTDHTYGSRHLAQVWEEENLLKGIEVFVLLDLLGQENPIFFPIDKKPHKWWKKLVEYEHLVTKQKGKYPLPKGKMFQDMEPFETETQDDHMHFRERGVQIFHLIARAWPPGHFPPAWHTMDDNMDALDWPTITKLNHIFRLFVAHYLELFNDKRSGHRPEPQSRSHSRPQWDELSENWLRH